MNYDEALENCIFRFVSGSRAYGTNRPDSDEDFRGVFVAPLCHAFDLFHSHFVGSGSIGEQLRGAVECISQGSYPAAEEHVRQALETNNGDLALSVRTVHKPGSDEELQELRQFLKLASDCNPNITEFLWVDRLVSITTPTWELIRNARDMFMSRKARHTFSGYAFSQLKRIETHRGYLLNPPTHKPTRAEFSLPCETTIARENQNAILSLPDEWVSESAREIVRNEKRYNTALSEWNAYQKWDRERNPARKALEARHGYDTKHATHLIRLCRMGVEILRDGVVLVYRPDRDELRGIINGDWPYEKVLDEAAKCDALMGELYGKTPLKDRPNHKGISDLYREICEERYGIKIA